MIHFFTAMMLVGAMHSTANIPPDVSTAVYVASVRHDVDPVVLGGYLVSEHAGLWTEAGSGCSSHGACGPFQLVSMWPQWAGYEDDVRAEAWASADIAARLINYSKDRHRTSCNAGGHNWRAHLKCSRRGRDNCHRAVESWRLAERKIRDQHSIPALFAPIISSPDKASISL